MFKIDKNALAVKAMTHTPLVADYNVHLYLSAGLWLD